MLKAIMFGAIGTLVETSELQRQAFNEAFAEEKLEWTWDKTLYWALLSVAGGRNRIRHYAQQQGQDLSEDQVISLHSKKTDLYQQKLKAGLELRPGVARLIREALDNDIKLALASATLESNIRSIADAVGDALPLDKFDVVMNKSQVENTKPAPDIYQKCLKELGIKASEAVAIEDTALSLQAAVSAGLVTVATPGRYTSEQDFSAATVVVEHLGEPELKPEVMRSPLSLPASVSVAWLRDLVDS